jgi:Spy/CpxP family protein refolding chaperone
MMSRTVKSLLLAGLLTTGAASTAVLVARADAPGDATAAVPGDRGPMGKHRRSMSERLSAKAQELGLSAQQLGAIKAAEDNARPELEKLQQALRARHEALRTQIDGILTADQRAKLKAMREQHGHRKFRGMRQE